MDLDDETMSRLKPVAARIYGSVPKAFPTVKWINLILLCTVGRFKSLVPYRYWTGWENAYTLNRFIVFSSPWDDGTAS